MSDELEQVVRDSLTRRADDVDTTAPLVARARRTVRRRRAAGAVLASAAAVAVVLGLTQVVGRSPDQDPAPAPAPPTQVTDPVEPSDPVDPTATAGWRTERWHDLAVDVPADWGYGPAPMRSGGTHLCGDKPSSAYVGRPIYLSDVCIGGKDYLRETSAPYAWLGADLDPGTVDLGDGYVQETVRVAGTTLTVATRDESLRQRILGSARTGGTCLSELRRAPTARLPIADTGDGLLMCAYDAAGGRLRLVGSELLEAEDADRFARAYDAETPFMYRCLGPTDQELVVLQAGQRQFVVRFTCPGIAELGGGPGLRALTAATVRPWAGGVVPFVLHGPTGGKGAMIDSFIGTLG